MIDRDHDLSITRQAKLLNIGRGTVYHLPQPVSPADLVLMRRIDELLWNIRSWARACWAANWPARACTRGDGTSERSCFAWVSRRWRRSRARANEPRGTKSTRTCCVSSPLTANQVWALDTTCIPTARGFVYLTAVVNVAWLRVLAYKMAITLEACHANEVIVQAFARHGVPKIVNTDQGCQFTATEFEAVLARGCKLSMDGRGAWRDNVFVERLSRSVK